MPSKPRLSSEKAAAILSEVPVERAFYFYSAVDHPLSVSAKSLREFCEKVRGVEPASLAFHLERQDFERWVTMLGDSELSKRFGEMRVSKAQGESLSTKLYNTAKNRLDQLERASMKIPR